MAGRNRKENRRIRFNFNIDFTLLVVMIFLLAFGLIMIYSASAYEAVKKFDNAEYFLFKQFQSTLIGVVGMIAVISIPYRVFVNLSKWMMLISGILVCMVFSPLGTASHGARRWIAIPGFGSFQPAELVKIAVILYTVYRIIRIDVNRLCGFKECAKILAWPAFLSVLVLVLTKNLSSAIIIGLIPFFMLFVASKKYKGFLIAAFLAVGSGAGVVFAIASGLISRESSFRFERIGAWLDPQAYASGKGFQTLQALYSIGSGGIFGKGLGQSMQKMGTIPEAQNDMIFSIVCEELGSFGALAIMLLFILFLYRCMIIARNARERSAALIVTGVMVHLALQIILNIAVVTNTIPNTGITLPFISYGGTSVVFTMAEVGLVLNVSKEIAVEQN